MGVLDDAATGIVLGEQHVLVNVLLVDAPHGADVDAYTVLHVDARSGDDGETRHGLLLP